MQFNLDFGPLMRQDDGMIVLFVLVPLFALLAGASARIGHHPVIEELPPVQPAKFHAMRWFRGLAPFWGVGIAPGSVLIRLFLLNWSFSAASPAHAPEQAAAGTSTPSLADAGSIIAERVVDADPLSAAAPAVPSEPGPSSPEHALAQSPPPTSILANYAQESAELALLRAPVAELARPSRVCNARPCAEARGRTRFTHFKQSAHINSMLFYRGSERQQPVLPITGSEALVQSANSLPHDFQTGMPAYEYAVSVQHYFAGRAAHQVQTRSVY